MSKSRLTVSKSLEVPQPPANLRRGSSPPSITLSSPCHATVYAGSGPTSRYSTPDPSAGGKEERPDEEETTTKLELKRMQSKEAILVKMLNQEREQKVRAEHLVEVHRLACLKLKHLLLLERKIHRDDEKFAADEKGGEGEGEVCVSIIVA